MEFALLTAKINRSFGSGLSLTVSGSDPRKTTVPDPTKKPDHITIINKIEYSSIASDFVEIWDSDQIRICNSNPDVQSKYGTGSRNDHSK